MISRVLMTGFAGALAAVALAQEGGPPMTEVRLMTLDPGHFHAALVQKEMYPDVAPRVDVTRRSGPISSSTSIASPPSTGAPTSRPPGSWRSTPAPTTSSGCCASVPATSSCCRAGTAARSTASPPRSTPACTCSADKPWILEPDDLPKLEAALAEADSEGRRGLRHHDGAVRDHLDPPARAGERRGDVRRRSCRAPRRSPASTWRASTT